MSRNIFRHGIAAALLLLIAIVTAGAQEFRGSITGQVIDPNGAALPGAGVTLKNVETNAETNVTATDDGTYSFPLVQPGKYTLTVTQEGFNTQVRENIEVGVAAKLTLDVKMEIGVAATVTTVAESPVIDTGTVATGTNITSKQISELPLTEGTAYQLATLTPGVTYTGNPAFTGPTSNGNLAAFRSNGAVGPNQITLDGSPNYAFEGGVGFSPPSDAVQEFKVQTNTFDAQQGYSAGATVNVAVKSGTNDLHGSMWYFNRDRSRTANSYFNNRANQERPERTYHRFGGVVNGPVYIPHVYNGRDKTFFLFSYERLKDNIAEPQLFTVPTEAMRRGDFSALIRNRADINATVNGVPVNTVIYNPFSGTQSGTNVVRTSFGCPTSGAVAANSTCNIIPTSLFNPVAQALMQYYPLPNTTGVDNGTQLNYFSNVNRVQNYRAWLTRLDHRISDTQSIFGKYYHSFNPEDRQNWAGEVNGFPITQGFENRTNDGGNIDYTNTLTSTMVFDIRVSLSRFQQERLPAQSFDPATLPFTAAALSAFRGYDYLPRVLIRNLDATRPFRSTLGAARSDWNAGRIRPFYMGSVQPTMTQIWGNHTMKYGYDLRILRENFISNGYQGGQFFFDGTFTSPASNSNATLRNAFGRDVAAFLFGIPTTGSGGNSSQIDNPIAYSVQQVYHGFFFQDDWRVTPKLTLNVGLRYEVEGGITERYNRLIRGFDPNTPSPIQAQVLAAYTTAYNANPANFPVAPSQFAVLGGYTFADDSNRAAWNSDKGNWQPRFGLSYQLDEKTVLRGGFGIFISPRQIPSSLADTTNQSTIQPGFSGATPFVPSNNNGLTFVATLSNPFPTGAAGLLVSQGAGQGLLTRVGLDVGASDDPIISSDYRNPKFSRLVLGIQRELPGGFVLEANYVSAWGRDLAVTRNLNFVPRSFLGDTPTTDAASNTFLSTNIPNPFRNIAPTGSPFATATNITRAQSLLRFPQFTNVFVQEYNGTNRYNALQLQVQQRLRRDLTLSASYTRSRLREEVNYLNPSDTDLEDRISPDDRPNRFTFSAVYELPFGRGRKFGTDVNRFVDVVLGGWQLNGTYEWQSGEPFLLTAGQFYSAADFTQLESRVGQTNELGQKYGVDIPAFDTSAFVRLTGFGIRNVPTTLDNLRNQPYLNVNLSASKNFRFDETKRLQLRIEALNAFNHPYFALVNLDPNNASFGLTTSQRNNPRDIQIGVKFVF